MYNNNKYLVHDIIFIFLLKNHFCFYCYLQLILELLRTHIKQNSNFTFWSKIKLILFYRFIGTYIYQKNLGYQI